MRSAMRLVIVALSVLLLAFPALPSAVAATEDSTRGDTRAAVQTTSAEPAPPASPAPAGPKLEQADQETERAEQRRKIVMGVACAVLIGIVVWGRSIRQKKAKSG